ncbi:hypothetical protein ABNG03_00810 [Halorubrum sp. RMP-47]|uniref:DUF2178 domain-containing protein n=1 Tax=Halorubrum miltondacostae TaxID=3076378 RepID=A0ABD5LYS4_9EURY
MPADAAGQSGDDWLATRTRYRRLSMGSLFGGIVGLLIIDAIGPPLAAVVVYWLGFVGFFTIRRLAPMPLFDERDQALERRASYDSLRVVGAALIIGAPSAAALEQMGRLTVPPVVDGALIGIAATFGVFGLTYLARRYA